MTRAAGLKADGPGAGVEVYAVLGGLMTPRSWPIHIVPCWSRMRRTRACSAGSAPGRSSSSTCGEAAGYAAAGKAPLSPGSRGRAGVAGVPPAGASGHGLLPGPVSHRVPDTAPTMPSAAVGVVKAGVGAVRWGAPWGTCTTPVVSSSTWPTMAFCRRTTSRVPQLVAMTRKDSPGKISCTPLAMVTPCAVNRREVPKTWPGRAQMVRAQTTVATHGGGCEARGKLVDALLFSRPVRGARPAASYRPRVTLSQRPGGTPSPTQ